MKYALLITLMAIMLYGWIMLLAEITGSHQLSPFITGFGGMLIAGFISWLDDQV